MSDYRRILDKLPLGVWVGRVPDGQAEYVNEAFQAIMGVGASSQSVIEDAPATYGIFGRDGVPYPVEQLPFSRVLATGGPVLVEDIVIHRPDGSRADIRAFGHPVLNEAGAATSVIVAFLDISREVRAETERQTIEGRLALVVNHAPVVIWTADTSGRITLSEGAGLRPLGVVSGQLIGENLFDLYKDHPTILGNIRRALAGESFQNTAQVGQVIYDTWLTPIRDAAGTLTGIAGLSHDVSEIRRLQAEALQNDRMIALGTLAASVAHEINNPLTYVLGHLDLASQSLAALDRAADAGPEAVRCEADRIRRHLDTVRTGAERMAGITRELRTFSRPDDRNLTGVTPSRAVRSVLELVGKELEARARTLIDLRESAPVSAVEGQLIQAILNLVVNALQAVDRLPAAEARIELRTYTEGSRAVIEVADNGPGVPPADRERIFDAFFSTKEIGRGTGLGLFVCRNIVRAISGDIVVDERPGGGARFRIRIPLAARTAATAATEKEAAAPRGARRVLVVDDEVLLAKVLAEKLRMAGYEAVELNDGDAALERLLGDEEFDLVFCDLMMRGTTGMALAERLDRDRPGRSARLVFMTGGAFTPEARRFLEANADRCVDKPFNVVAEARARIR